MEGRKRHRLLLANLRLGKGIHGPQKRRRLWRGLYMGRSYTANNAHAADMRIAHTKRTGSETIGPCLGHDASKLLHLRLR